jgi:hypothetical protein
MEIGRSITVFTSDHHWSQSWARWIQSTHSHPISLRFILILSSNLCLRHPSSLSLQISRSEFCALFHIYPRFLHAPTHHILLDFVTRSKLCPAKNNCKSPDSSVGIANRLRARWSSSRVRFPVGDVYFSLYHRVQNGFGTNPASYPICSWGSFPGGKAAGAWIWPLTSI